MDYVTGISVVKSLLDLEQAIANIMAKAQGNRQVERRVLYYLEAVQEAVQALGIERQRILTDARRCDIARQEQVNALWERLDRYLFEDNIRPLLQKALDGLRGCREEIEKKAQGLRWRKRDKQKAVKIFLKTHDDLESLLQGLASDFYPGGSGMGVQTLMPIYELLKRVRNDLKIVHSQDVDCHAMNEELGELILQALRDNSHEAWIRMVGDVEKLINELQLTFTVEVSQVGRSERISTQ